MYFCCNFFFPGLIPLPYDAQHQLWLGIWQLVCILMLFIIRSLLRLLLSCTFSFLFFLSLFSFPVGNFSDRQEHASRACDPSGDPSRDSLCDSSRDSSVTHHMTQSHDTGASGRIRLCATASSTRLILHWNHVMHDSSVRCNPLFFRFLFDSAVVGFWFLLYIAGKLSIFLRGPYDQNCASGTLEEHGSVKYPQMVLEHHLHPEFSKGRDPKFWGNPLALPPPITLDKTGVE